MREYTLVNNQSFPTAILRGKLFTCSKKKFSFINGLVLPA